MRCLITLLFLCSSLAAHAQSTLYGIIRDSSTREPIPYANILIKGTVTGTSSDESGSFKLKTDSLPVTLVITCIGYRTAEVRAEKAFSAITVYLSPSSSLLKEVVIGSSPLLCIQKDLSLMAADFEFYDNYLLVLAHKDFRSPSRLMLLDESGNNVSTLYVSSKLESLYRDCFGNVHVQTKDSAWQVFYDYEKLQLLFPTTMESMRANLYPCELFFGGRIFMSFHSFHNLRCQYYAAANGVNTQFHYACDTIGTTRIMTNYDIRYFLEKRRRGEGYNYSVFWMKKHLTELQADVDIYKTKDAMSIRPVNAPLFQHDNALWIFQFGDNVALRFNDKLNVDDSVRINFHNTRDWTGDILRDEVTDKLYTTFLWEGWLRICALNDQTFEIENEIILEETPFPTELKIRNGVAYFLFLDRKETSANRMLYRYRL